MTLSDDVIEAGARAQYDTNKLITEIGWDDLVEMAKVSQFTHRLLNEKRAATRACLTAALRQMEREGVWCGRVPEEKGDVRGYPAQRDYAEGFDAAIAEFHANRITGGTDEG